MVSIDLSQVGKT